MNTNSWVRPSIAVCLLAVVSACTSTPAEVAPATGAAPSPVVVTPGAPPPAGATGAPKVGVSTLPAVPAGESARFSDAQIVAKVLKTDSIKITGQGPGQVSGPAVGVTVEIGNESPAAINLNDIVVNASYANGTPASPADVDPAKPLAGKLDPGKNASGVYVFSVPTADAGTLVYEINYAGSADVALIRR